MFKECGVKETEKFVIATTNREEIKDDSSWGMFYLPQLKLTIPMAKPFPRISNSLILIKENRNDDDENTWRYYLLTLNSIDPHFDASTADSF